MPTIAIVDGVKIRMYYNDHTPPHFHALLGDDEMLVSIENLDAIRGALPTVKHKRVIDWARNHQAALVMNWTRCQNAQTPERID